MKYKLENQLKCHNDMRNQNIALRRRTMNKITLHLNDKITKQNKIKN